MALPVPQTRNGDHFYSPNYPPQPTNTQPPTPKPRKNHIGNAFGPLEKCFLAIHLQCKLHLRLTDNLTKLIVDGYWATTSGALWLYLTPCGNNN